MFHSVRFRNGSIFVWRASTGRLQFKKTHCHSSDVASVKVFQNVIVSGGRDKFVKVCDNNLFFSTGIYQRYVDLLGTSI